MIPEINRYPIKFRINFRTLKLKYFISIINPIIVPEPLVIPKTIKPNPKSAKLGVLGPIRDKVYQNDAKVVWI